MSAALQSDSAPPAPGLADGGASRAASAVPERILAPLRKVASRHRRARVFKALLQFSVLTLLIGFASVVLLGLVPATSAFVHIFIAVAAYVAVLVVAIYSFRHAFRKTSLSHAALHTEQAFPDVQERLSSVVELAADTDERFRGSPALIARLTDQAQQHAAAIEPHKIVSWRHAKYWLAYLMPVLAAWVIFALLMPETLARGFHGAIKPWDVTPPPTIALKIDPGSREIPAGDPLDINVSIIDPDGITRRNPIEHVSVITHYQTGQSVAVDMDLIDPKARTFHKIIDATQQDFDYQISTDLAQSEFYHIHVLPRPAVGSFDIQYSYPAYTRLKDKTVQSKDGVVDALVGTQVRLIIHANQKLSPDSRLFIAPPGTAAADPASAAGIALTPVINNDYAANFTVQDTTQYSVRLAGDLKYQDGQTEKPLTNKDDQFRPIIARLDLPPTIAIVSPADNLHVRPTDVVPVKWQAGDDFGVAAIQVIIETDHRDADTPDVPFTATDPTNVQGEFLIDVHQQLERRGLKHALQIAYQFKVTDNCPTPHSALSARQVLWIDEAVESLAAQEHAAAEKDLQAAIDKALEKISDAQRKEQAIAGADKTKPLTSEERHQIESIKNDIANLQQQLDAVAKNNQDGAFKDVADKLKDIADNPIKNSADSMAKAQLSADDAAARQPPLNDADRQFAQAHQDLDALNDLLHQQKQQTDLADALRDLAAQQQALAQAMQQANPADAAQQAKLAQQERDLQKKIDDLIKSNPDLQKPVAQGVQPKVDELIKRLDEIQKEQQDLANQTQAQIDAQNKLSDLAQQQKQLNADIGKFAQEQAARLNAAKAAAPPKENLDAISKNLDEHQYDAAATRQEKAAAALDSAAAKMEPAQRAMQSAAQHAQDHLAQDQQQENQAKDLQNQAQQLQQQIQDATNKNLPPTRPSDPANQQADKLADDVQKAADAFAQHNPDARAATDAAKQQAAQAKQDAAQGQAPQAQQALAGAADKLANLAGQRTAQDQNTINQANGPQATQQARDLADRQHQLAKATQDAAADQARPDAPSAAQTPEQQKQVAQKIDQAAREADAIAQQTQAAAPQVAQRAAAAAQQMRAAATTQQSAADAGQKNNLPQDAKAQQQAQQGIAQAKETLRGVDQMAQQGTANQPQPGAPQQQQLAQGPTANPPGGQAQQQQSPQGENPQQPGQTGQPNAGQPQAGAPQSGQPQAGGHQTGQPQAGEPQAGQPHAGGPQSGQAQAGQPQAGQSQTGQPQAGQSQMGQPQAGGAQTNTPQTGESQTGQPHAGQPQSGQPQSGEAQAGQPQPTGAQAGAAQPGTAATGEQQAAVPHAGSPHAGGQQSGSAEAGAQTGGTQNPSAGEPQQATIQPGQPGQGMDSAAQDVQSAHAAAGQAAHGDQAAAQQAAQDLKNAAQALAGDHGPGQQQVAMAPSQGQEQGNAQEQGQGNKPGQGQGAGHEQGQEPGQGQQPGQEHGLAQSHGTGRGSSGNGAIVNPTAPADARPAAVKDVGISPSDWARLPPLMQQELLNAAQQKGPPAYQEMIKDYYVRIAHLQAEGTDER